MADDETDIAKWLQEHPSDATSLKATLKQVAEQYRLAESAMETYRKRMAETSLRVQESLKASTAFLLPTIPADAFLSLGQRLDAIFPKNWPRPIPALSSIESVLEIDGIPIVHIPRAEIVRSIVDADDYDARVKIVEDRADDIAEDCRVALDRDFHRELSEQIPLAKRAIAAFQDGHHEAAQALAVAVCDTYLKKLFAGKSYTVMQKKVGIKEGGDYGVTYLFNLHYVLSSASQFLTPWFPGSGQETLTKLSRHVTIHHASTDHMTRLNATVAIMLVTAMSVGIDWGLKRADHRRKKAENN